MSLDVARSVLQKGQAKQAGQVIKVAKTTETPQQAVEQVAETEGIKITQPPIVSPFFTPEASKVTPIEGGRVFTFEDGGEFALTEEGKPFITPRRVSTQTKNELREGTFADTSLEVDHVISKAIGGTDTRKNLQTLKSTKTLSQTVQDFITGKDRLPGQYEPRNRQEGKVIVEQKAINKYKRGDITLPAAREAIRNWDKPEVVNFLLEEQVVSPDFDTVNLTETISPELRRGIQEVGGSAAEKAKEFIVRRSKEEIAKSPTQRLEEALTVPVDIVKGTVDLLAKVPGFMARQITSGAFSLIESTTDLEPEFKPEGPIEEAFFGQEPIVSFRRRVDESKDIISALGADEDEAGRLAIIGVGLSTMLDLPPLPGKAGKAKVTSLVKNELKDQIGEKLAKDIAEDVSRRADELITIRDPIKRQREVENLLDGYNRVVLKDSTKEIPNIDLASTSVRNKTSIPLDSAKTADKVTDIKSGARSSFREKEPGFELSEETKFQKLQRNLQDKMNRLGFVQKTIEETKGVKLADDVDAYLQAELFIGRAKQRLDNFDRTTLEPLLKTMKDADVSLDEFGTYLYAKHAPERNAKIFDEFGKLNGSGMTDDEAKAILKGFQDSGKLRNMDELQKLFQKNITNQRINILREAGILSTDSANTLRTSYNNYAPLKGRADLDDMRLRGQGFSLSGKDIKRAKGRESQAQNNPFTQAVLDFEDSAIRAEKNKVGQTLLKLAEENPNPKVWEVENLKFTPVFDKSGEIQYFDPKFKFADNVVQVYEDGKLKLITIHDKALAEAMKNMGTERGIRFLQNVNNFLRSVNTTVNPEFLITNFERDIQTALIHLGGEQSAEMAGQVLKDVPSAMKGVWNNVRKGDIDSEWAALYQEMKEQGGRVGFFDSKGIEDKTNDLLKKIRNYQADNTKEKMASFLNGVGEYVEASNEAVESATRLSAYKAAKDAGMSKERAAQLAKNLTINFNKKGNWGSALNSLYLFANAGIQGSTKMISAMVKSPKIRKIAAGIVATSYGLNEMNHAINAEEYKKIDDSIKDRNYIFMMPNGNYIKVPLPYGYNILKVMGDVMFETTRGQKTPTDSMKRLAMASNEAFNPLSSGSFNQTISPTFFDPFVQAAENKNWFGGPIKPENLPFGPQRKESDLYFGSVRPTSKKITNWINKATGGNDLEAGFADVSPELLDHFLDFTTGGAGRFVANTFESGTGLLNKDFPDIKNMPFVRKLIGTPSEYYESRIINQTLKDREIRLFDKKEEEEFKSSIRHELLEGNITRDEAKTAVRQYLGGQSKVKANRAFEQMQQLPPDQRADAVKDLDTKSLEQLKKLISSSLQEQAEQDQQQ